MTLPAEGFRASTLSPLQTVSASPLLLPRSHLQWESGSMFAAPEIPKPCQQCRFLLEVDGVRLRSGLFDAHLGGDRHASLFGRQGRQVAQSSVFVLYRGNGSVARDFLC